MAVRAARSIEMSPAALTKFQAVLREKRIGTAAQLLSLIIERAPTEEKNVKNAKYAKGEKVNKKTTINGEPTARKAINGERIDKTSWILIFDYLDLYLGDFFTDAEWFGRDPIEDSWAKLLDLAEDAFDRFGLVFLDPMQEANFRNAIPSRNLPKYMTKLPLNSEVVLEMPSGLSGHLILLEQNTTGGIDLLSPSPLMKNTLLAGAVQLIPQCPVPEGFAEKIHMTQEGTRYLWAGIFDRLPEWDWLADTQEEMRCDLQVEQLTDLLAYAKTQPAGTPIWRSSYTVA
jgi:hypothetical protein